MQFWGMQEGLFSEFSATTGIPVAIPIGLYIIREIVVFLCARLMWQRPSGSAFMAGVCAFSINLIVSERHPSTGWILFVLSLASLALSAGMLFAYSRETKKTPAQPQ